MKIFFVLPAYNEAENLPTLIKRLIEICYRIGKAYEIILVDDGSTDETDKLTLEYKDNPIIKTVKHLVNKGLGYAIDKGFKTALKSAKQNDLIITMDADDTHDAFAIPRMVEKFDQGYDLILASRFQRGGGDQGISPIRRTLSHAAGLIFQLIFPIRGVREYTCSYRGYRASLLKKAYEHFGSGFIREKGFNCMLEILVKLSRFSPNIIEVPFTLFYDRKKGKSKMDVKKTLLRYVVIIANSRRFI